MSDEPTLPPDLVEAAEPAPDPAADLAADSAVDPSAAVRRESAKRTRRSFLVGGAVAAAGYGLSQWIDRSRPIGELQAGLRGVLEANAAISRGVFGFRGLAPTFPLAQAQRLRLNGTVGLDDPLHLASWRLQLVGVADAERSAYHVPDVTAWQYQYGQGTPQASPLAPDFKAPPPAKSDDGLQPGGATAGGTDLKSAPKVNGLPNLSLAEQFDQMAQQITHKRYQGDAEAGPSANALDIGTPGLLLPMDALAQLPRVELITEFKCIEGWSQVTQWSGYRLRDLIDAYPPAMIHGRMPRYVYMETPNGDFYCGYDMAAARHPQSLLVTHMSGEPLAQEHGAPLRLHMPIKYGYKQIKRIGLIAYTDSRPDDYWTKLGYDWYAGI